ncbi:MAG: hypothetical protein ACHQIM_18075, partial [Sphingobacteriales bacterium]
MSRLTRVTFFSKHDMTCWTMLEKAETRLEQEYDFSKMDLNSLLEFHHIHQYFENDLFLDKWTPEQKAAYAQKVKTALAQIRVYISNIIPGQLFEELAQLEFDNRENFWELLQYFELYKKLDASLFSKALKAHPLHIRYVLSLKQLVQHYNSELRAFLLTCDESAELLLSHYEEKQIEPSKYIFPKNLTDADKHAIILAYLESPEPNLNYVELVRNSKNLKLPPKILLKAKQISDNIKNEIFSEENTMKMSVVATLDKDQIEPVIYENKDDCTRLIYGGLFFDLLTTDVKLFSVFSEIFLYTDKQGLISLVNKNTEMDVLETVFMQSKNEYHTGFVFAKKSMLSLAQLGIFNHYLVEKGRSIEDLLANVIEDLFQVNFKINGLTFSMPDASLSPSDKIRLLAPEVEYLLKQYENFVTDGNIDHELLQIDSTPVFYSELHSLLDKKYIFSTNESIRTIQYHFFDENSLLAGRKDPRHPKPLFHRFEKGPVRRTDFEDYQISTLEQAIEAGDLVIQENGLVEMVDPIKVIIAGELRKNGTISYWHFGSEFRAEIDRLINDGVLTTSTQLFTTDEIRYINFYLNKKEFTNGKDLRNKYLHGSNKRDLQTQELDYLYFLRTFILILLKLRD